nr:hypothetical protein [bacterium]
ESQMENHIEKTPKPDGTFAIKVKKDYSWNAMLTIPEKTIGSTLKQNDTIIKFQIGFNFIEHMYQMLLQMAFHPQEFLSEENVGILIFFCKLVVSHPMIIFEIQTVSGDE